MLFRPSSSIIKPTLAQIAALGNDYFRHPRYQGCVGHWLIGEGGGTKLYDISPKSNLGTLSGFDLSVAWTNGEFGNALRFDGGNNFVSLDSSPLTSTQYKNGFTFIGWFNTDVIEAGNNIIIELGDGDWVVVRLRVVDVAGNGKLSYWNRDANPGAESFAFTTTTNIVTGKLYHFAVTYDGAGNWILYLEGLQDNTHTSTITGTYNLNAGTIGSRTSTAEGNEGWDGLLDEMRVYDRPLTAGEVWSHRVNSYIEFQVEDVEEQLLSSVPLPPPFQSRISIAQP